MERFEDFRGPEKAELKLNFIRITHQGPAGRGMRARV